MVAGAGVGPGRTAVPGGERVACGWKCTSVPSLGSELRCEAGQERREQFAVPGEAAPG